LLQFDDENRVKRIEDQQAILIGVGVDGDMDYSMQELAGLAEAAGIRVAATFVQNLDVPHPGTYIGKGKIAELAEMCSNMDISLVIANDELSGTQLRNMEQALSVSVIDRTLLILDIFATRATSRQGKLQVEMAQLQYRLPRLAGLGKALSRLGGGIGTRGPGEKKLETDRRHIQRRIRDIAKEMHRHKKQRDVQRARSERSGIPIIALVGYTNAGKSSVMNRFLSLALREEVKVTEKDLLFTTLDASHRLITLPDRSRFLLVDTVGFVSKLPHALVEAFHSTLEEVVWADLLLHVVDATFQEVDFHIDVTKRVLAELGAAEKPALLLFNKSDIAPDISTLAYGSNAYAVSAKTGAGFELVLQKIKELLFADLIETDVLIPYDRGDLVSYICAKAIPSALSHTEDGTRLSIALSATDRKRVQAYIVAQEGGKL